MNRRLVGLGSAAAYALLLALALDFRWDRIVNLPQAALVAGGTGLLWLLDWSRGRAGGKDRLRWRLMVTGFLVTVAGQVGLLTGPGTDEPLSRALVAGCLPLFYSVLATLSVEVLLPTDVREASRTAAEAAPGGADPALDHAVAAPGVLGGLSLTRQEHRVAEQLRSDAGNKEISARLFISENTLKKHIRSVYQKAGVTNRTEFLARYGS